LLWFDCTAVREPACLTIRVLLAQIGIRPDVRDLVEKVQTRATDFFWWGYSEPFD
jgi:hypothetical protein